MIRSMLVPAAALAAAAAAPAAASLVVVGSTDARMCYESADSPLLPQLADIRRCDDALTGGALTAYETLATHVNRGILQLRRGQIDAAVADFDSAIRIDPGQPEAYLNKGAALIRRQDAEHALPLFTMALDRNTTRPAVAHYGRAVAYEALGNLPAAYRDYQAASAIDPHWAAPRDDLARFRLVGQQ